MTPAKTDNREEEVRDTMNAVGTYVHIAMWYLIAVKDHNMAKFKKDGSPDKRDKTTMIANRLNIAVFGKALEP